MVTMGIVKIEAIMKFTMVTLAGVVLAMGIYSAQSEIPELNQLKGPAIVYGGLPKSEKPIQTLNNTGFTVGYSNVRKSPVWVAYRVDAMGASQLAGKRPSRFTRDLRVEDSAVHSDYTNSGFDRGHLAPNFAIATRYGSKAQKQTFLMTNVCPQLPTLNQQVWKKLEMKIAKKYAPAFEKVWVITGPIFDEDKVTLKHGIEVPDEFYKIVIDEVNDGGIRALAFIFPQEVGADDPLEGFLTSIDNIESKTKLDFLSNLKDSVEDDLEKNQAIELWLE